MFLKKMTGCISGQHLFTKLIPFPRSQERDTWLAIPFSQNYNSSRQSSKEAEDTQDYSHMTLSSFCLLTELALVTSRTLAASDFVFCNTAAMTTAVLEITGCRVFLNWKYSIILSLRVSGGGNLGRVTITGFSPKIDRVCVRTWRES